MEIEPAAIRLGLPGRVYLEADDGMIHLVRVELDPRSGTARVRSVLTGRREYDQRRTVRASHQKIRAQLHKDSADRLLSSVPASTPGPVVRDILARLERKLFDGPVDGQGRHVGFVHITTEPGSDGESLRKGHRLFLLSGRLRQTRNGNDVFVNFAPPGEAVPGEPPLKVEVYRRFYSHREDLLPHMFAAQEDGRNLDSQVMLVELLDTGKDELPPRGATKRSSARPLAQLATLLQTLSGQSCLATVAEQQDKDGRWRTVLELEPGALFETGGLRLRSSAEPGAVVRLTLRGAQRVIDSELAAPSDLSYIPEGSAGRVAVVLPKSTLMRQGALSLLTADRRAKDYTVAGLPGVEARADSDFSRHLMGQRHPKTAAVVRTGTQVEISAAPAELVPGRLRADTRADTAKIAVLSPPDTRATRIGWPQLSFADTDIERIAAACRRRSFFYGDALTGHWEEGETPRFIPKRTTGPQGADEIVLASIRGDIPTLRHTASELRQFGFPAAHLVEILTAAAKPGDREFTVAGVAYSTHGDKEPRGLWLEIRPGHLVEVLGAMMADAEGRALSPLMWEHFAPGDRVTLGMDTSDFRSLASMHLERWRPGPRAGFALREPTDRVLLPVAAVSTRAGSLSLGAGRYCRLIYPAGAAARTSFPVGSVAWLTGDNQLQPGGLPEPGDTVLLGCTDGRLHVHGVPGAAIELSGTDWPDAWIRDAVSGKERPAFFDLLGHALPVTVEAVSAPLRIVVSRRRQPSSRMPGNSLLWARFLGPFESAGDRRIVLESGGAILAVPVSVLVLGLPSRIEAGFGARDSRVWLHTDGEGHVHGGRPAIGTQNSEILAVIERALGSDSHGGSGFVCREKETSSFRWLPAERTGWCEASAADLEPYLRGREVRVTVEPDGGVSLIDTITMRKFLADLSLGDSHRIEYLGTAAGATRRGLARIHLSEVIVEIDKLDRYRPEPGAALLAEVAQRRIGRRPKVVMVPQGRRRVVLDLPPSLTRAMRRRIGVEFRLRRARQYS